MKLRLIIAAGLLSMVGACFAGPNASTPTYFSSDYDDHGGYYRDNGYYDITYYNGRSPGRSHLPWE